MNRTGALLDLESYVVRSFELRTNDGFNDQSTIEDRVNVEYDVWDSIGDQALHKVAMVVSSFDPNDNAPYIFALAIAGFFRFNDEVNEETRMKMLWLNAPSILYGLARGYFFQATSAGLHGGALLPTVNFVAMRQQKLQQQAALTSTHPTSGTNDVIADGPNDDDTRH